MDILVTTPKAKHLLAKQEARFVEQNPNAFWFRTIHGKPNVQISDRVYYVDNGQITGYGIVFDIETGELQCELTGKIYKGTQLKQRKWVPLKNPIFFKGFQGFRYVDRIKGLREKLSEAEGLTLSLKRHADQLKRSAYDSVYYNAEARIKKALQNDEITEEQAEKLLEKLEKAEES